MLIAFLVTLMILLSLFSDREQKRMKSAIPSHKMGTKRRRASCKLFLSSYRRIIWQQASVNL